MNLRERFGNTALILGASEGIGEAFSKQLAEEGMNLIVVARRKEPLEEMGQKIREQYRVTVDCICCDLADLKGVEELCKNLSQQREINLLVYNAALAYIGPFEANSIEHHHKMAVTNIITPMYITQLFGSKMILKGNGAIILMSSLAGFQGSGYLSVYAASKAFSRVFAEGLWYEWKQRGVAVIACCAGATSTPNFLDTNPGKPGFFAPKVQTADQVVKECFEKLGKQPSFVSGTGNKIAAFIMQKIIPRKLAIKIMGDTTKKMYRL
ncbi:MAG: SDR family NAD(P)-dependent oxidoreductase [Ferruginibacter sp.]